MNKIIGNTKFNIALGFVGMLLVIYGTLLPFGVVQKLYYLIGAALMLLSAILEKQAFFVILEIVVVAGTAIALMPFSNITKACVPLILSVIALIYFYRRGELKDKLTCLGCAGLIFLALGFGVANPFIYLIGGLLLAIYGYYSFKRGVKIALLWSILNTVFVFTSLIPTYHLLFV